MRNPPDSFTQRVLDRGMIPTIDPGQFVGALRAGRIAVVPGTLGLDREHALLEGGGTLAVDTSSPPPATTAGSTSS